MNLASIALALFTTLPGTALVQQQDQAGPVLWSGTPRADLSEALRRTLAHQAADLPNELARTLVRLKADRNFDAAWEELSALRLRVAEQGSANTDLMFEITRARVELKQKLGAAAEARQAARTPWPTAAEVRVALDPPTLVVIREPWLEKLLTRTEALVEEPVAGDFVMVIGVGGGASADEAWLEDLLSPEKLAYLRDSTGTPSGWLSEYVMDSLSGDVISNVVELGSQAAPALALLVLEDLNFENQRSLQVDPLALLIRLDEGVAARLALDWIDRGGHVWRRRVMHWIPGIHDDMEAWLSYGPGDRVLASLARYPAWLDVLAAFLLDPQLREEALRALGDIVAWDALTPLIAERLSGLLTQGDLALSRQVLDALGTGLSAPSAAVVYLAGLSHPLAEVRHECARRLADLPATLPAFLEHAADQDPVVRGAVARSLRGGVDYVTYVLTPGLLDTRKADREGRLGGPELLLLGRLLEDADAGVRSQAKKALISRTEIYSDLYELAARSPSPAIRTRVAKHREVWYEEGTAESMAVLEALISDPSPEVRAGLLSSTFEDMGAKAATSVISSLAQDRDVQVLAEVDEWLADTRPWKEGAFIAALPLRIANSTAPFEPYGGGAGGWRTLLRSSSVNMSLKPTVLALLRAGIEMESDDLISACVEHLLSLTQRDQESWERSGRVFRALETRHRVALYDACERLPLVETKGAALVTDLLDLIGDDEACLVVLSGEETPGDWVWRAVGAGSEEGRARLKSLCMERFRDPSREVSDRLHAAGFIDALATESDRETFFVLLHEVEVSDASGELSLLEGALTGPGTNKLLIAARRDEHIDPAVIATLAGMYRGHGEGAVEAAIAVLQVRPRQGRQPRPIEVALGVLGRSDRALEQAELMISYSQNPAHVLAAVQAMSRHAAPQFMAAIRTSFGMGSGERAFRQTLLGQDDRGEPALEDVVIQALLRYPPTDAAEQLRAGLLLADSEGRKLILEALVSLERYWELERLAESRTLGTRDEALAQLVTMLESEDASVRVEAAKSIAAFGVLESLPNLIPLLKDQDADVRAAAREAIDRLREVTPPVVDEE